MSRVLITGHRGLLGSACVRLFRSLGHDVVTTDLRLQALENARMAMAKLEPDVVIHAAARVGGIAANKADPIGFLQENLNIQNAVFSAAFEHGVQHLVFVGTSCMYPKHAALPVKEDSLFGGFLEPDVEAYALAKIAGWRLVKAYREQHGLNWTTIAPCNIYGSIGETFDGTKAHVVPALIKKLYESQKTGKPFEVWGDGTQVREFIHADDVASAIYHVLTERPNYNLINVGPGYGTSIAELCATLFSVAGCPPVVEWKKDAPRGIEQKTYDITRIKSSTTWAPKIRLEDGLRSAWNHYKSLCEQ
jgi:GDP-L-fucose synthase